MLTTDFTTLFLFSFYFPFFFPLCIRLVNCEHLTMFFLRVFSFLSVYTFRMYIYIYIHFSVEIRLVPLFLPASRLESRLLDFSRYSQAWMGRRCNGVFLQPWRFNDAFSASHFSINHIFHGYIITWGENVTQRCIVSQSSCVKCVHIIRSDCN